jgi:hypothetical protein
MFTESRKLLCIFSIVGLIGSCIAGDLELGEQSIDNTPKLSTVKPPLVSQEALEETAYVTANVIEVIEGITKSAAIIGMANLAYENNETLGIISVAVSLVSAASNGAKNVIRAKISDYHKKRIAGPIQSAVPTDGEQAPTSVNLRPIHHHDAVTDFELRYLAFSEKLWKRTSQVLGYLEVGGQYIAPILIAYARTLPDGDSYKQHIINTGYSLNAGSSLCYFYRVLAQNQSQNRHQEFVTLEETPDV